MTKGPKKRLGNRCQRCHKVKEELDAARIREYDREKIIAKVLGWHMIDRGQRLNPSGTLYYEKQHD